MLIKRLLDYVGIASAVSVALLPAVFVASPVIQLPKASASGFGTELNIIAEVDQALAFTATPEIVMGATQSYGKTVFSTGSGSASLRTNVVGYVIQMSAQDTSLVNQTTTTAAKKNTTIPTIESTQTGTAMVADSSLPDSWGYTTDRVSGTQDNATDLAKTYSPIPTSSSPVTLRDTDFYEDGYDGIDGVNIGYGVKVSPDLRSGLYTGIINFTVVGYVPIARGLSMFDIRYLQSMTPEICANTTTPLVSAEEITYKYTTDNTKIPRTILIDKRDNKTYLVSKFADGHCWMSQNLELALDKNVALTSELTDLNTKDSWTPARSTIEMNIDTTCDWDWDYEDDGECYIYSDSPHPGREYVSGDGVLSSSSPSNDKYGEWQKSGYIYSYSAASADSNKLVDSDCHGLYWDYMTNDESIKQEYEEEGGSYDYSDNCAVRDSICPRGWSLPDVGTYNINLYPGMEDYTANNEFIETYKSLLNQNPSLIFTERFAINPAFISLEDHYDTYEHWELHTYKRYYTHFWTNLNLTGASSSGYDGDAGISLYFSNKDPNYQDWWNSGIGYKYINSDARTYDWDSFYDNEMGAAWIRCVAR